VVVTYDWEDDGEEEANSTLTTSTPKTFLGFVANGVSYVLFGLAVVAFYRFLRRFSGHQSSRGTRWWCHQSRRRL